MKIFHNKINLLSIIFSLYCASIPFESILAANGKTLSRYLAILCAGAIIIDFLAKKINKIELNQNIKAGFIYFSWAFLSLIWTSDFDISIKYFWLIFKFFIFYIGIFNAIKYLNYIDINIIKLLIIASTVIAAATAINLYSNNFTYLNSVRASIIRGDSAADPNHFAASLLLGLSLIFNMVLSGKKKVTFPVTIGFFLLIIVILMAIVLSGSRAGLFGAGLIMLGSLIFNRENIGRKVYGLILLFLLGGIILYFTRGLSQELLKRYDLSVIISSGGAGRTDIWRSGLDSWRSRPILGYGIGMFSEIHLLNIGIWKVAHNIYLETIVDLGLIGLFLFLFFLGTALINIKKKSLDYFEKSTIISLYALSAVSFFLGTLNYDYFWITLLFSNIRFSPSVLRKQGDSRLYE